MYMLAVVANGSKNSVANDVTVPPRAADSIGKLARGAYRNLLKKMRRVIKNGNSYQMVRPEARGISSGDLERGRYACSGAEESDFDALRTAELGRNCEHELSMSTSTAQISYVRVTVGKG